MTVPLGWAINRGSPSAHTHTHTHTHTQKHDGHMILHITDRSMAELACVKSYSLLALAELKSQKLMKER